MTERITVTDEPGLRTIRFDDGKVNTLDVEVLREIRRALEQTPTEAAVVLSGNDRAFSAGIDLAALLEADADATAAFVLELEALMRVIALAPCPIIAAVTGHAIGGGCLLALACHYRVMGDGKIGLVESLVGFPVPPASLEIVRYRLGPFAQRFVLGAATVRADVAESFGLIDEQVPAAEVTLRATEIARQLSGPRRSAFTAHLEQLRAGLAAAIDAETAARMAEVLALWCDDGIRQHAADYLASLSNRRRSE